jgi:tetratricopeptide (TPR) repeat protein
MIDLHFVQETLDKLLEVVEVEFKIPLGIAEIKFPAAEAAKRWWGNEKSRAEVETAIRRAEEKFIAAHTENRLAQILHDFPLYADAEYRNVILELLKHLDEEKITWLAELKIENEWDHKISSEDIRRALELYVPFLRHELNGIKEFREIIMARMLERIDERTERIEGTTLETADGVRRIETKLDRALSLPVTKEEPDHWYIPYTYPMPPNFTGREAELQKLDEWLDDSRDRLFILHALGGFGKSALAWQWISNNVDSAEWPKLVFWTFLKSDTSFELFIEQTLKYLQLAVPQGQRPQVEKLIAALQSEKILLVLDGFEQTFYPYSGTSEPYTNNMPEIEESTLNPLSTYAEIFLRSVCSQPNIRGKVLMTTRMIPNIIKPFGECLQGCHEEKLDALLEEEAIGFFQKHGIKGTKSEIKAACSSYGNHPLSLHLLACHIVNDFEHPFDMIVAQKLKTHKNILENQKQILDIAYNSLSLHEQKLLSTIACSRLPIDFETIKLITEDQDDIEDNLHNLMKHGLLDFDRPNIKFGLHPIVRQYAYSCLTNQDRITTHKLFCEYYAELEIPEKVTNIDELTPAIELYYHTVKCEQYDEAFRILKEKLVPRPLYFQFGAYQLMIELENYLFFDAVAKLPRVSNKQYQAWLLNSLGVLYTKNGQPSLAISLFKSSQSDDPRLLVNFAISQMDVGKFSDASNNLSLAIQIAQAIEDNLCQAAGHLELGRLYGYMGIWSAAEAELRKATNLFEKTGDLHGKENTLIYWTLLYLASARTNSDQAKAYSKIAIQYAEEASSLSKIVTETFYPVEHDFAWSQWLMGFSYRIGGRHEAAKLFLDNALTRARSINLVEIEANILVTLALLRYDEGHYEEAKSVVEEALLITERCGYVLQDADANLFLAQYALEQEKDRAKAKEYAETALKLAYCDGPPYYYKVAYQEAERMLDRLK